MADLQRTVLQWPGGTISFDCVEVEDTDFPAELTKYTIERGAKMTDHIVIEGEKVRLGVIINSAPSDAKATHVDGQPGTSIQFRDLRSTGFENASKQVWDWQPVPTGGSASGPQGGLSVGGVQIVIPRPITLALQGREQFTGAQFTAKVRSWGLPGAVANRVQNVLAELLTARAEVRLFTVVTEFRHYPNMAIAGIHMTRTPQNPRAPKFEISLEQLFFADLVRRDVSNLLPRKPKKARSKPPVDSGKKPPAPADPKTEEKSKSVAKSLGQGLSKWWSK